MTSAVAADKGGMPRASERPLSDWVELIWLHAAETPSRVLEQILDEVEPLDGGVSTTSPSARP